MVISEKHMHIHAQPEQLASVVRFVTDFAQAAGLDDDRAHHCSLAVDEACSNIIEHGYRVPADDQTIDITCCERLDSLVITIMDHAPAYNPLKHKEPDPDTSLEQRSGGGWGISFIRRLMDEVSYRYEDNHNILQLTMHLTDTRKYIVVQPYHKHVHRVMPVGDLDSAFIQRLVLVLEREINAAHKSIVLDLSGVPQVTGDSLKALVPVWQRARESKGDIVLASLNTQVQEVMSLTGFDLVFSIYPTVDAALARHKFR